jgi:hypothetical protein
MVRSKKSDPHLRHIDHFDFVYRIALGTAKQWPQTGQLSPRGEVEALEFTLARQDLEEARSLVR